MSDLFDDMAQIFVETFGDSEGIRYTPKAASEPLGVGGTIKGIWVEAPVLDGLEPQVDGIRVELHVSAADVPDPQEGDAVVRLKTGRAMKVVPPIRPDGHGMIAITLSAL